MRMKGQMTDCSLWLIHDHWFICFPEVLTDRVSRQSERVLSEILNPDVSNTAWSRLNLMGCCWESQVQVISEWLFSYRQPKQNRHREVMMKARVPESQDSVLFFTPDSHRGMKDEHRQFRAIQRHHHSRARCIWRTRCRQRVTEKDHSERSSQRNHLTLSRLCWSAGNANVVWNHTTKEKNLCLITLTLMKKPEIIAIKISIAWKHTAQFMRLVRHKLWNGNLHWNWDQYSFALIRHFREVEATLNDKLLVDERWWDRHSEKAKKERESKRFCEHEKIFDRWAYDDELREIIKSIDDREKAKNLS